MNQHFHDFPRFREPTETPRGPAIEGHQVWILVEEIFVGDYAFIDTARVWASGVDGPSEDEAAFKIDAISVGLRGGPQKTLSKDNPFEAVLWDAVVKCVEGSQHYCNEIMDRLMEAAS